MNISTKANFFNAIIIAVLVALFLGCENPEAGAPEKSATPTADTNVFSISESGQRSVTVSLTSANTGEWKVYDVPEGEAPLWNISAFFQSSLGSLTLTSFGETLPAGTFYVSVTESGKTESGRLMLRLLYPSISPTVNQSTVDLESATQSSVEFTLTNSIEGEWKIYSAATGGDPLTGISVAINGSILTLSADPSPFAGGTYYVSVTQPGRLESTRLGLTVNNYDVSKTVRPRVENDSAVKFQIPMTSVTYTLSATVTYSNPIWKVYSDAAGAGTVSGISASSSGSVLTLSHATDIAVRTYYVSATDAGKGESSRLPLQVVLPDTVAFTVNGSTVEGTNSETNDIVPLVRSNGSPDYSDAGGRRSISFNSAVSAFAAGAQEPTGGDWIELNRIAGIHLTEENWTMELIIRDSITAGSNMMAFLPASGGFNANGCFWLELNTTYWLMRFYDTTAGTASNGNRGVRIVRPTSGRWHHISYVRTGGTVTCYVDGVMATAAPTGNETDQKVSNNPSTYFRKLTDETPVAGRYLDNPLFATMSHIYIGMRANVRFHQYKMTKAAITPEDDSAYYAAAMAIVDSLNQ